MAGFNSLIFLALIFLVYSKLLFGQLKRLYQLSLYEKILIKSILC